MHVGSNRPRLGQRLGRSYTASYNVNSKPSQLGHKRVSKQGYIHNYEGKLASKVLA